MTIGPALSPIKGISVATPVFRLLTSLTIGLPAEPPDQTASVIVLKLEGPVEVAGR
jgi:hypothetical protein